MTTKATPDDIGSTDGSGLVPERALLRAAVADICAMMDRPGADLAACASAVIGVALAKIQAAERELCAAIAAPERIPYSDEEWRVRCEVRDAIRDPDSREVGPNAGSGASAEARIYCYSTDEENYFGDYRSREDALAEGTAALEDADKPGETRTVWTGVQRHAMHVLRRRAAHVAQSFAEQMEEWLCDDIVSDEEIVVIADATGFGHALLDLLQQHARFARWAVDDVQEHEVIVPGAPEALDAGLGLAQPELDDGNV